MEQWLHNAKLVGPTLQNSEALGQLIDILINEKADSKKEAIELYGRRLKQIRC